MGKIKRDDLLSLEAYHKARPEMRAQAIAVRKTRTVNLGEHLNLIFENRFLMQYQIQEMLRVERIFEEEGIDDELSAYNPLVPDGSNFKVTMKLEYVNEVDRKIALAKLVGIEDRVFLEVEGQPRTPRRHERRHQNQAPGVVAVTSYRMRNLAVPGASSSYRV